MTEQRETFDEVADRFEAHVARNGLQNIRLHRIALGERSERRSLITPTTGNRGTAALAEELGINVFYGGHYATETFGVKALSAHLAKKYRLPWTFLDHPTGL